MAEPSGQGTPGKPKSNVWRSQFSMGELDFARYHRLLTAIDDFATQMWNGDFDAIKPCFSALKQFYLNVRTHLLPATRLEMDEVMKSITRRITSIEDLRRKRLNCDYMIKPLLDDMEHAIQEVFHYKQMLGFGVEMEVRLSRKKKWGRAAGVDMA